MKHVFIVNPTAGKGRGVKYIPEIDNYFKNNPGDYDVLITERPKHATEIAAQYHKEDDVILYSVGGDGTAKEILDGINPGVTMCVVPGGTGNDFFKSVDKRSLTMAQQLKELIEGENMDIDIGLINGSDKFMNIASFGVDADINVYACDYVKVKYNLPGSLVYAYSALKVGTRPQNIDMKLTVDGTVYERTAVVVGITNGKYYGGCFKPAPQALLDDGLLDICVINGPISLPKFFKLIIAYTSGKHVAAKEVEMLHGKEIKVEFKKDINLQIDGENTKLKTAEIRLLHKAQSIRVPKNRETY